MKQHTEKCEVCGMGTAHAVFDDGLAGHVCDHCGTNYATPTDMAVNMAVTALVEGLGYKVFTSEKPNHE